MRAPFLKTLYPETATLSVDGNQARVIREELMGVAVRPVGTDGGVVSIGAVPVPASVTPYTLAAVLMLRVPLAVPPTTGAKTTNKSQCVPGGWPPARHRCRRRGLCRRCPRSCRGWTQRDGSPRRHS